LKTASAIPVFRLVNTFLGFAQNSSEREATSYNFPEELRENPRKHPPRKKKSKFSAFKEFSKFNIVGVKGTLTREILPLVFFIRTRPQTP
jgi:hypothetical protein